MADTAPLLNMESSPAPEEDFPTDIVFFHGKELRSSMGMRQSFIRKPGTEQVLVRIGIGRDGVFKVDGSENKILEHWKFSDLKDWSFSGYSCTLQFHSANFNYSVRTDDGETICAYIEDFQKHPEQALKKARENPPNSRIPESGLRTLRRKFSGTDLKAPTASDQVKFYTMNRRTSKKSADPTSKMAHNIEVDSRLRTAHSQEILSHSGSESGPNAITPLVKGSKMNGIPNDDKGDTCRKQTATTSKQDKPVSSSVRHSPTSTRGEATRNQTTLPAKSSGTSSPSQPSSPLLQRHVALEQRTSEPLLQTEVKPLKKRTSEQSLQTEAKPLKKRTSEPSRIESEEYFVLRQRSVSETTVQRGNSRPINLVKTVTMPWSSHGTEDRTSKNQVKEVKVGRRSSNPVVTNTGKEKHHSPQLQNMTKTVGNCSVLPSESNDRTPLLRVSSSVSNSSGTVSPDIEFQLVPPKQYERRQSREGEGKEWYQTSESPDEQTRPASPPYDTLSHSDSSEKMDFSNGIRSLKREDNSSMDDFSFCLSSPPNSPLYDHLPPSVPEDEIRKGKAVSASPPQSKKTNYLPSSSTAGVPIRRNISQPVFGGREDGRGASWSSTSPGPDSIKEEDEEDSDDEFSAAGGVVRRKKKSSNQRKESDPFEDLLGTPQAVARLRWSQELNPLYDLIKGMKITESITSQDKGIKLYAASSPSITAASSGGKKIKKLPSVIFEESETSPKHGGDQVPVIAVEEGWGEGEGEGGEGGEDEGDRIPMIIPEKKTSNLARVPRRQHEYEEVAFTTPQFTDQKSTSIAGLFAPPPVVRKTQESTTLGGKGGKSSLAALANPVVRKLQTQTLDAPQERSGSIAISPRLGKRELQRRSRTISCMDDTEAVTRKQRPLRAADTMKDFSFVMREFRLFYIKMPNGCMHSEVFSINRQVAELRDKLCDLLGVDNVDHYLLYVEGACLTSLKESEIGEQRERGVGRSNSLTHIMDHQWLPDQGSEPVLLKLSLSFSMQGITTSRVLALVCDDVVAEANNTYPSYIQPGDEAEEFHKHWISIVQGNIPCTPEQAVKLAAIQYQAYFLDRTAIHSVVGFCRPNEFLPTEFSAIRGLEQKMYKEQERLKTMKTHKVVHEAYINQMSGMLTYGTIFFPVREPRKKMLQSTKLKPVVLGVGPNGIMRVDPKTKEVLDSWDYQVLRNWAYSRKTFVLAFTDKNYPVESNQAKWISMLVDFFVDSIITISRSTPTSTTFPPISNKS